MSLMATIRRLARAYAPKPVMEWRQRRATAKFANIPPGEIFGEIYRKNVWGDAESRSGGGSTVEATSVARDVVGGLVRELGLRVLHDIPCGDFNWMRHVDLGDCAYIGSDIVP